MVLSKAATFDRIGSAFISTTEPQAWLLKWNPQPLLCHMMIQMNFSWDIIALNLSCTQSVLQNRKKDFSFFYAQLSVSLIKTFIRSRAKDLSSIRLKSYLFDKDYIGKTFIPLISISG